MSYQVAPSSLYIGLYVETTGIDSIFRLLFPEWLTYSPIDLDLDHTLDWRPGKVEQSVSIIYPPA